MIVLRTISGLSSNLSAEALSDQTLAQLFARAQSAIVLTDPKQDDNPVVACNAAFLALTGYSETEVLGRNCRFLQGPDTDPIRVSDVADAVNKQRPGQFELLNYRKDGTPFWNALHIGPIYGSDGEIKYFFGSQYDITSVIDARLVQAREHESLSHALQAARAIGTFDWDVRADLLAVNEGFARAFGLDPLAAAKGLPVDAFYEHVDPADVEGLRKAVAHAVESGEPFEHEYGVQGSDRHRWLMGRGRCLLDTTGRPTRFSGIVIDVTKRRRAENDLREELKKSEILRQEIDHRIKNLFAIVPAIVNMSARRAADTKTLAALIQQRIGALARSHSLTLGASTANSGVALAPLCRAVLAPYRDDQEQFEISGPVVRLRQSEASAVALLLHELATNSAKHGSLSVPEGAVRIAWAQRSRDRRPMEGHHQTIIDLEWRERGGPPVTGPPEKTGSGSRLIDQLTRSLGGEISRLWDPEGLRVQFSIPTARSAFASGEDTGT